MFKVTLLRIVLAIGLLPSVGRAESILFVGNSFTFGSGSPVRYYRPQTVTDLNDETIGGIPALFKSFTVQAGLAYDVALETHPGVGLDWHVANRLELIASRPWDQVILQGHSMLDLKHPGNPAAHTAAAATLAQKLRHASPNVQIRIMATWPRADQVYDPKGNWAGKSVEAMAADLRAGSDQAAAADPAIKAVLPVGEAWIRAFRDGIADPNPYDGIDFGKVDLWTYDHYHASVYGGYLEALIVFGGVTGRDPRSLGATECSGFELGLSMAQVASLQKVAFDQLWSQGSVKSESPAAIAPGDRPQHCARLR